MDMLLNGINTAKTTDAVKVAKALEGKQFDSPIFEGESYFRAENHALMWPMWVGNCDANGTAATRTTSSHITDRVAADKIDPAGFVNRGGLQTRLSVVTQLPSHDHQGAAFARP